jgi:hypothetical protein
MIFNLPEEWVPFVPDEQSLGLMINTSRKLV